MKKHIFADKDMAALENILNRIVCQFVCGMYESLRINIMILFRSNIFGAILAHSRRLTELYTWASG